MKRQLLSVAGIVLVSVGMAMAPAGAAGAINGTGTVSCSISGTLKFKPAIVFGGTMPGKVSISVKATGCSGTGDGAHIVSGTVKGSENTTSNDCTSLAGTMSNALTASAKWKQAPSTPKLNASTLSLTSETGNTGPPVSFDASGTVTAGSFNGDSATAHAVIQETTDQIFAACSAKGVKTLHITTGSSTTLS